MESVQYDVALAMTCAVRGISKEKLYQKLGFESRPNLLDNRTQLISLGPHVDDSDWGRIDD